MNSKVSTPEIVGRANALIATGNSKEAAARKLSAEFAVAAYVSGTALWATCLGDDGRPMSRVLVA